MARTYRDSMVYGSRMSSLKKEIRKNDVENTSSKKKARAYVKYNNYEEEDDFSYSDYKIRHM